MRDYVALILIALLPRLLLAGDGSYRLDMNFWITWSHQLALHGPQGFYAATGSDYLPGYLYVLWLLGHLHGPWSHLVPQAALPVPAYMLFKAPAMAADVATVLLIYRMGGRWATRRQALLAAALYALNPAPIANSTLWGQVDAVPALLMVGALWLFLEERPVLCGAALALSVLAKPTALVLLPLLAALYLRRRRMRDLASFAIAGLVTSVVVFWPFLPNGANPLRFVADRFMVTTGSYPLATANAFNLWALVQPHIGSAPDSIAHFGVSAHMWGWILMGGLIAGACALAMIAPPSGEADAYHRLLLPASCLLVYGFFAVLTRIHERHLLPTLPLLAISCVYVKPLRLCYLWLSLAYLLNSAWSFAAGFRPFRPPFGAGVIEGIAAGNVITLVLIGGIVILCARSWPGAGRSGRSGLSYGMLHAEHL